MAGSTRRNEFLWRQDQTVLWQRHSSGLPEPNVLGALGESAQAGMARAPVSRTPERETIFSAAGPASGSGLINPGAINADNVLASIFIPASLFDIAGRTLYFCATGNFGNNTNSKRCKIIAGSASATVGSTIGTGGTTICDTLAYSTTGGAHLTEGYLFILGPASPVCQKPRLFYAR
jgi:hypothetical protein